MNEKRTAWWAFCFVCCYRGEQQEWSSGVLALGRSTISCHGRWHAPRDITFSQAPSFMDIVMPLHTAKATLWLSNSLVRKPSRGKQWAHFHFFACWVRCTDSSSCSVLCPSCQLMRFQQKLSCKIENCIVSFELGLIRVHDCYLERLNWLSLLKMIDFEFLIKPMLIETK